MMKKAFEKFGVSRKTQQLTAPHPRINSNEYGHINSYEKGASYQADLMFMPEDDGYRYLLTVVDIYNNDMDVEPLKSKHPEEVLRGFKKVFGRKHVASPPKYMISLDNGSEFKGVVKKYFNDRGVAVKYARPYRHMQQGKVEAMNSVVAKILMTIMKNNQLITDTPTQEWVKYVRPVIDIINKNKRHRKKEEKKEPICNQKSCELLPQGTKVRVVLEYPEDYRREKLSGKSRHGDIRWSKATEVEEAFLIPNQPVLYKVKGHKGVLFKRKELQVVK